MVRRELVQAGKRLGLKACYRQIEMISCLAEACFANSTRDPEQVTTHSTRDPKKSDDWIKIVPSRFSICLSVKIMRKRVHIR